MCESSREDTYTQLPPALELTQDAADLQCSPPCRQRRAGPVPWRRRAVISCLVRALGSTKNLEGGLVPAGAGGRRLLPCVRCADLTELSYDSSVPCLRQAARSTPEPSLNALKS